MNPLAVESAPDRNPPAVSLSAADGTIDHMFDDMMVPATGASGRYPDGMTVHASDVAAEIRRRLPGVGVKKLHKLLYYCQGHHLAVFEAPIFSESLSAWDMGPVVGRLWWTEKAAGETSTESGALDEAALNTIGYVLSRYGRLTGRDLEHMTHAEDPWRLADRRRDPGGSEPIGNEWILAYFRADLEDEDTLWFDQDVREGFLAGAQERRSDQVSADSVDGIRARAS